MDSEEQQLLATTVTDWSNNLYRVLDSLDPDARNYFEVSGVVAQMRNIALWLEDPKAYLARGYRHPLR